MEKSKDIKPSKKLYGQTPESWMFMPYYSAVEYKEELANKILEDELKKHYMKQDQEIVTREYQAANFNSGLRGEMDHILKVLGIENADQMFEEMKNACDAILEKYKKRTSGDPTYDYPPGECIKCGSENITGMHFDYSGGEVWQEVRCNSCNAKWTEVYEFCCIEG